MFYSREEANDGKPKSTLRAKPTEKAAHSAGKSTAKYASLGFASEKSTTTNSAIVTRFRDAIQRQNLRIEVFHLILTEDVDCDIFGFSVMDRERYYWTWKPSLLEQVIQTETKEEIMREGRLDDMLHNIRAANVRGARTLASKNKSKEYESAYKIYDQVLFGLMPFESCEDDVRAHVTSILDVCKNIDIRTMYSETVDLVVTSDNFKKDVKPGHPQCKLWLKLEGASKNIVYKKINYLAEIMTDEKVEDVFLKIYKFQAGESPSYWPKEIRKLAFGELLEGSSSKVN